MKSDHQLFKGVKALSLLASSALISAPAGAAIVLSDFNQSTPSNASLSLDVNLDGLADLRFDYQYSSYYGWSNGSSSGDLYATGINGAMVTAGGPLALGAMVNAANNFSTSNHMADYNYSWYSGSCGRYSCYPGGSYTSDLGTWNQGASTVHGYLGFALTDGVEQYFGWADVTMWESGYARIGQVGYEACANVGIAAGQTNSNCIPLVTQGQGANSVPEPSSLALLAMGAVGAGVMRRRKQSRA